MTDRTEEIFRENGYARSCEATVIASDADGIRPDRTVFYPEGGGQPGDTGLLRLPEGPDIPIVDTRKGTEPGQIIHVPGPEAGNLRPGQRVEAVIDWDRRHRLMRMHTCLHLLSAVIVAPVTGGQVSDGKGRLDFDLAESPDKEAVTHRLNALIEADHPVRMRWISDEELAAQPELVKTMSVAPPTGQGRVRLIDIQGIDLQPCGGTHLASTGEIGPVRVSKIEKKGRQNRRVRVEFV
ncbi:MAG: alanyl-tRNA editing protein [Gammaproteobacteria bacterium]|jgi:misacylated tRNA(Ala) deacylase